MPFSSIYLDNSTITRPSEQTISRMMPFFTTMWGVPSAPHQKGYELHQSLTESFKTLYQFVDAHENDQLVFTSSGAEAVNHVIQSVYRDMTITTGKNQFITSCIAEAPAIMAIERLEHLGCIGKLIPVNGQGLITAKALSETISPRTALISIPWADGLTGVIQPLNEISDICKQRGILLHIEATHVLGKLFFELKDIQADFITFNGDQLHAPKGTGGLYIRQGVKCSPFISGGSDQAGLRAGSINMPSLVALANAAKESLENRDYLGTEIARLRDRLENGILQSVPQAVLLFKEQERLPHCTTIAFPGITNESLLFMLNRKGIYASIGGGNFQQLTLILKATGLPDLITHGAISFSLSRYTREEEIDQAITIISENVNDLLSLSNKIITKFKT